MQHELCVKYHHKGRANCHLRYAERFQEHEHFKRQNMGQRVWGHRMLAVVSQWLGWLEYGSKEQTFCNKLAYETLNFSGDTTSKIQKWGKVSFLSSGKAGFWNEGKEMGEYLKKSKFLILTQNHFITLWKFNIL